MCFNHFVYNMCSKRDKFCAIQMHNDQCRKCRKLCWMVIISLLLQHVGSYRLTLTKQNVLFGCWEPVCTKRRWSLRCALSLFHRQPNHLYYILGCSVWLHFPCEWREFGIKGGYGGIWPEDVCRTPHNSLQNWLTPGC